MGHDWANDLVQCGQVIVSTFNRSTRLSADLHALAKAHDHPPGLGTFNATRFTPVRITLQSVFANANESPIKALDQKDRYYFL